MQLEILFSVSATSFIWLLILYYINYSNKKEVRAIEAEHNSKIEHLLTTKHAELRESYEKGALDADMKKDLTVVVRPWREETENGSFWKNKKSVKVGYSHQLYSNGVPCMDPYITVCEEVSVEKTNQDNINAALQRVDLLIANLPIAKFSALPILSSALLNNRKKESVK